MSLGMLQVLTDLLQTSWLDAATMLRAMPATAMADDAPRMVELWLFIVVDIAVAVLLLGMALCLYRVIRGPHLADRVLAADVFAIHVVGLVLLLALRLRTMVYFDVALVVAIIGFASTIAFSQYIYARSSWKKPHA